MGDRGSEPEAEGFGAVEVGFEDVGIGCPPGPGVVTPGDSSPAMADEDWFWWDWSCRIWACCERICDSRRFT